MSRRKRKSGLEVVREYLASDPWSAARAGIAAALTDPPDKYTDLGTRCASTWDSEWIAQVNATEARLGRRICGARTMNGTPCTVESNHPNGRCRFHGGFALTGAPPGNRNALLHGLYSRRLQSCGQHCALWQTCPCAGDDVLALDPKERPTCPYEQTEYNAFVSDAIQKSENTPDPDPLDEHAIHTLALLHVMSNRAASALSVNSLTETVTATANDYRMETVKLNTHLQAFLRIAREYRAFREQFDRNHFNRVRHPEVSDRTAKAGLAHVSRQCVDTNLEPESQALALSESTPTISRSDRFMRKATKAAAKGDDVAMLDAMHQSLLLDPVATLEHEDAMLAAYRPRKGSTLPEDAVRHILKHMKIDPKELYPDGDDIFSKMRRDAMHRQADALRPRPRRPRAP